MHGTYDWRKFQVFAQAASDVEKAVLAIGIQHGQGTLYMDDVKITLVPDPGKPRRSCRPPLRCRPGRSTAA